jgi:predicted DNA-binding ribbon-helix-helix protein
MVIVRHGSMNIFIRRSGQVQAGVMKSVVIKRSILINGRKTSVSLENEFWDALHEIAEHENVAISALVEKINEGRNNINLSSAIRVFVFNHYRPINGKEAKQNPIQNDAACWREPANVAPVEEPSTASLADIFARARGNRYLGDDSAAFNLRSGGAGHLIECGDFTRCPCLQCLQCLFQASNKGAIVKGLFQVPECSGFQHAREYFHCQRQS